MGFPHIPEEKRLAIYWAWKKDQLTYAQIAHAFKIHLSTVNRILQEQRKRKWHRRVITTTALAVRTEPTHIPNAVPVNKPPNREGTGKYSHLFPDIQRLRAEGFGPKEVALRVSASRAVVGYYFKKIKNLEKQQRKALLQIAPHPQGVTQNGESPQQLSKDFLIGYGSAEIDRVIDGIAGKLQLPTHVLRNGFSRFLGSTAVRRSPRPAD